MRLLYFGLIIGLVCHSATAEESSGYDFRISVSSLSGKLEGYLQTPAGGEIGRSDYRRPTFDELDIDKVNQIDLMLQVTKGRHSYSLGATLISLDERTVLAQPLLSQWQTFQSGDPVAADIQLDWYRLGYSYDFSDLWETSLDFAIGSDISTFDFHYQLDGPTQNVNRAYAKTGLRAGLELSYPATDKWTLSATAYNSLPFPNTPSILTMDLNAEYSLWHRNTAGSLLFGISYHRIDYEDDQEMPNHIRAEMGPLIRLGFIFRIHQFR